jgi:tetratricopeptide (TPR) repeat protein
MTVTKKRSPTDKIILGFFFIVGFLIDPFAQNTNPWGLRYVLLLVFTLLITIYFAYKTYKNKTIPLLKSKILVLFFFYSLFPILIAIVQWQKWYINFFSFQQSVLIPLILSVITFIIANSYNELKYFVQLIAIFLTGQIVSSFISLGILILNYYDYVSFPNFSSMAGTIIFNSVAISTLVLLLAPPFYDISKKGSNEKGLLIFLEIVSMAIVAIFYSTNILLIFALSIILIISLIKKQRRFALYYILNFAIILIVGLLLNKFIDPISELRQEITDMEAADLRTSANVIFNALESNNPLLGLGNVSFTDVSLMYAPNNDGTEFVPLFDHALGEIWEIILKYGLITLLPLFLLISASFRASKKVFSKKNNPNTVFAETFVKTGLLLSLVVLIFGSLNLNLLLLISLCFVILAHFESKDYLSNESVNSNIKILSVFLIPVFIIFSYLSVRVVLANYIYGYANELYTSKSVENQKEALSLYQKTVQIDDKQAVYHEELAKIFYGVFVVAQDKLELFSDSEKAEVQKYFNNSVKYSNNAISLNPDGYVTWLLRFNLMKNLAGYSDTSETINKASDKLQTIAPKNGSLLLALAAFYVETDLEKSHLLVEKAYNSNPNVDKAKLEYAKSLEIQGKRDEAVNLFLEITDDESKVNADEYQEAALILKNLLKEQEQSDSNNTEHTDE